MSSSTVVGASRDHRIAAPADPHAPLAHSFYRHPSDQQDLCTVQGCRRPSEHHLPGLLRIAVNFTTSDPLS
jgi:hypothetical protein